MADNRLQPSILLVDKPAGVTSHDVVAGIRRERGGRKAKVGHAGTLDPFATGLLLILLGSATRLQRYLMPLPKTYVATARLGWRSSTGDPDGELTETGKVPAELVLPTGRVTQRLPMTSAVRVDGERLYRKAHRGEQIETPEREVEIHRADLVSAAEGQATFEVECSSGTYVRTLVETLEDAYCSELRRTAIGAMRIEDAGSEIEPAEALSFLPQRELSDAEATDIGHGRAIAREGFSGEPGPIALTVRGTLLGVGRADEEKIAPETVLS